MGEMRGVILLTLLGTALAEGSVSYSWYGPGQTPLENPAPENLCLTDPGSCGCCVMQRQLWRLSQFFNTSLNQFEAGLQKAQGVVQSIQASRSAFSVALTDSRRCVGPEREEVAVVYQSVFVNMGGSYNVFTGVFTAPRSGVYSLALTVFSDAGSPGALLAACARLRHNGRVLATPSERNTDDQEDSATVVLATQLRAGDTVSVRLPPGCFLCDDYSHYNTFSGFLLYAAD
ncbi:uncharacterized protein LOC118774392 [Megalops cyprinoides]|uniref:uncharacterized protein LOC118774392 n=1 Tax=Megalops cyprinoides TaxID=118141 RepID=UPI001864AED0|nr:uncharacterized protein LOC118774392 [Megalops cyprinoides]